MRSILLFCLMILSPFTVANEHFQRLAEEIGDKRIVFLDELTHGEKEVFKLKADVVRYLHQNHGFDAIVLESGMFDMAKLWQSSKSLESNASGNIFYMYANEPEFLDLLSYIDKAKTSERPLELAGFDGRLSGEISQLHFVNELELLVKSTTARLHKTIDWDRYRLLLNKLISRTLTGQDAKYSKQFEEITIKLINELTLVGENAQHYGSASYFVQLLEGVLVVANNVWKIRRFDEHDIAMADNLDWLLQGELKNKKIIVWGHFVHVNKHHHSFSYNDNATSLIRKRYKDQVYVVHFAGVSGHYKNFISGEVSPIGQLANSAEALLWSASSKDENYRFYDFQRQNTAFHDGTYGFFGVDYSNQLPAHHWNLYWDGLFLLQRVTASN